MLLTCAVAGWDSAHYLEPAHPLQIACRAAIEDSTGVSVLHVGTDGCGAPLMSTTLTGLARSFAQFARPDADLQRARIATAIRQHPEYLAKQLQEFKSGKRANAIMSGMVANLSEQDMKNIAAWLGTKQSKPGFAKDKELVTLGERIYRGGIADRNIAACAGCHSPNGAGIPAQYPRLSGQHADYTASQLVAFRDGVRKNSLQMSQVAAKLNDREIRAVADYIAGLR